MSIRKHTSATLLCASRPVDHGGRGLQRGSRADAQGGQGPRRADLWRQPRAPRLRGPRLFGRVVRNRRRLLPSRRRGDLPRSGEGEVHAAGSGGAFRRAQVGQDRCAGAQFDVDDVAGDGFRPDLRRRQLLRWPGFPGPQVARDRLRFGTRRRQGLRPERDNHDRQSRRLLQEQQFEIRSDRRSLARRRAEGLRSGQMQRADERRFPIICSALANGQSTRPRDSAGCDFEGATRSWRFVRTIRNGRRS